MADYTRLQNSFAAGYVDPTLHGLTNTEMYSQGLQECSNFIPSSLGYLYRRPGTAFSGWSWTRQGNAPGTVAMHAIKTPSGPMLVLFHDRRIDFFKEGGAVSYVVTDGQETQTGDDLGETTTASVPWEDEDLGGLDVYEFQGSLYIVHPGYRPHVIRNAAGALSSVTWRDEGEAPYAVTVAGALPYSASSVAVRSSFTCIPVDFIGDRFSTPGEFPGCQTFKGGRWYLAGTRNNPSTVYASKAMDVRGNYRFDDFRLGEYYLLVQTATYRKITVYETSEANGKIADVAYETVTDEEIKDRATLQGVGDILDYPVPEDFHPEDQVTRYTQVMDEYGDTNTTTDPAQAKVKVVTTTATTYTLKSDIEPDDGIELTESDMYGSTVEWLLTQQRVIAGTQRSIWMDNGSAATPADFDMVQTLASTVSRVHPVQYGSMVIYVPGDRRSVRGFYYDDNAGGYRAQDISMTARTLFSSPVAQLALCEGVETILWVLLEEGTLLSCTMGATMGWARHSIGGDGKVLSMVPYHADDGSSCLYLAVARATGDGNTWTSVERLDLQDLVKTQVFRLMDCEQDVSHATDDGEVDMDAVSDMYRGATGGIGWVQHDGWSYSLLPSGEYAPGIVSSGDSRPNPSVKTGYRYDSRAVMLWQELPSNSQTSLGMKRRASSILMQLYRSGSPYGGYLSQGTEVVEDLPRLAKADAVQERTPELFSGLVRIPVPSYTDEMVNAVMVAREPFPMTILAVESKYKIMEA